MPRLYPRRAAIMEGGLIMKREKKFMAPAAHDSGLYEVRIPVYYDHEPRPMWVKVFTGSQADCKAVFDRMPDSRHATIDEEADMRRLRRVEVDFVLSGCPKNNRNYKRCLQIKKAYGF